MNFKNTIKSFVVYLAYVILLGLFLCFLSCKRLPEISNATVNYSYNSKGLLVISMKNGKSFIIDTGAEMSFIFSDRLNINSLDIGTALVNGEKTLPFKRVDSLQIGKLLITNNDFVFEIAENGFLGKESTKDTNVVGVIGMDILSQKYCCFDIKGQTIRFSYKKEPKKELPSLILSYKSSKRPFLDLCINGVLFEDVLFDIGFYHFAKLGETDRKKLSKQTFIRQDTNYDFSGNQLLTYHEQFDSLLINGTLFSDKEISYGQKYRLLGIEFVKCWSSFVIDPFKMEIAFYL